MKNLSELYNATFKKNRGKASEGFVRPTLSEFFMTHKDFVEIESASGGWIRTLDGGNGYDYGWGITTDSSDNIYVTGYWNNGSDNDIFITKYNSSGTIQWQRTLDGGNGSDTGWGIATDSSDNIYVTGQWDNGLDSDILIVKYNSSGTIQWQRTLAGGGNGFDIAYGVATDSSDNIYVTGRWYNGSDYDIFITKYNSSGVIQWQRTLDGGNGNDYGWGITTDSSDNIYVTGYWDNGPDYDIFITKYNSSGVIQWQRTLVGGNGTDIAYGVATDSSDNIYVTGYWDNGPDSDIFITKLPNDGSGTGTYGNFTYAESSLTDSAGSLTDSAGSLTDSPGSLTDSAGSLTDSAGSLTEGTPYEIE